MPTVKIMDITITPKVSCMCLLISASDLALGSTLRQLPMHCTSVTLLICDCFLSLSILLRFIPITEWGIALLFMSELDCILWICHNWFTHSPTNGSQSCFQLLAMINQTVLNILFSYGHILSFLLGNICLSHVIDM